MAHCNREREGEDSLQFKTTRDFKIDFELLQKHWRNGKHCDLFIQSSIDDNKEIIPCHKIVLATVSPYFQTLLDHLDREGTRNLYFDTIDHDTLLLLLDYIYSGGRITLTPKNILGIFAGAKELKLKQLEADCLAFIPRVVTVHDVTHMLEIALSQGWDDVMHLCANFILANLQDVKDNGFYNLHPQSVKQIGQQYAALKFPAPEDWLKAVVEWLHHDEDQRREHAFSILRVIPLIEIHVTVLRKLLREDAFMRNIPEVYNLYVDAVEDILIKSKEKYTGETVLANGIAGFVSGTKKHVLERPPESEAGPSSKRIREESTSSSVLTSYHAAAQNENVSANSVTTGHLTGRNIIDGTGTSSVIRDVKLRKAKQGVVYFVAENGIRWTRNNLLCSFNLETKVEDHLGTYPFMRCGYSLLYHRNRIGSIGGVGSGFGKNKCLRVFDLELKSWRNPPEMTVARSDVGSVVVGDYLYVVGGESKDSVLDTVERFCLASNSDESCEKWESIASMWRPRSKFGIGVADGRIYVLGGCVAKVAKSSAKTVGILDTVECYDPIKKGWLRKRSMPSGRVGLAVATVGRYLYVIGGIAFSNGSYSSGGTNTVDIYDTQLDSWSPGVAAVAFDNYIYAIGGDSAVYPTMERFDIEKQIWEDMGLLPPKGIYKTVAFRKESFLSFVE